MGDADFLEHHGIKGQKWGIRNKENSARPSSSEHKKVSELKRRPPHTLTNLQLKTTNERLNLEQNFRRLNPTKLQIAARRTKSILSIVGVTTVKGFFNSDHGKKTIETGQKFIKKSLLNKHNTKVIFPESFSNFS